MYVQAARTNRLRMSRNLISLESMRKIRTQRQQKIVEELIAKGRIETETVLEKNKRKKNYKNCLY